MDHKHEARDPILEAELSALKEALFPNANVFATQLVDSVSVADDKVGKKQEILGALQDLVDPIISLNIANGTTGDFLKGYTLNEILLDCPALKSLTSETLTEICGNLDEIKEKLRTELIEKNPKLAPHFTERQKDVTSTPLPVTTEQEKNVILKIHVYWKFADVFEALANCAKRVDNQISTPPASTSTVSNNEDGNPIFPVPNSIKLGIAAGLTVTTTGAIIIASPHIDGMNPDRLGFNDNDLIVIGSMVLLAAIALFIKARLVFQQELADNIKNLESKHGIKDDLQSDSTAEFKKPLRSPEKESSHEQTSSPNSTFLAPVPWLIGGSLLLAAGLITLNANLRLTDIGLTNTGVETLAIMLIAVAIGLIIKGLATIFTFEEKPEEKPEEKLAAASQTYS